MVSGISNIHYQCVTGAPGSAIRIKYSNQYAGLYSNLSILFLSFSSIYLVYILYTHHYIYSMEPTTPVSKQLSRDQYLQVQTLQLAGHILKYIATLLNITRRQVQYTAAKEHIMLKRYSG